MTTVSFFMEGERIVGFQVKGHSGYAEMGSDIVCAAATSAVRLTECAVNDVLGLEASVKIKGDTIALKLPGSLGATTESTCQALLTALMVYFAELREEYPEHISVVEGD
jgi:uncharacterized protein YsxB (DUF464 family)